MSARVFPIIGMTAISLGALGGIVAQQRELTNLRAEERRLSHATPADNASAPAPNQPNDPANAAAAGGAHSSELLQLRSQISQLTERKRELTGLMADNARLRTELAVRDNHSSSGSKLPPNYIRKSQAQWLGMSTPDNTLQSFFWAVQHRDITNALLALTPEAKSQLLQHMTDAEGKFSPEKFFDGISAVPGFQIINRTQTAPDTIELQVEIDPGNSKSEPMKLRLINGEWRMDL